ncbi:uncharacterized protein BCR38DRAFT_344352 [Pseudomassariella vexata]|uniref:Uncharacterized protein n=1 Tax=Pseudomassariella vexata TaxID=1141098 RepID=A0A1Y2DUI2_9PEZI|nr:uncharacterized protein BCR38DRAFT_344352 [Pseudomassariella vexata]ORY62897.1 hypothetical protein BCR38DRAFT_344352 [Pseudomassariella vexata]
MGVPSATSSSGGADGRVGKELKGFGRVILRMRTVLRHSGQPFSKRTSKVPPVQPSQAPSNMPVLSRYIQRATDPTDAYRSNTKRLHSKASSEAGTSQKSQCENATRVPRAQIHEERAKKLEARFGLEIKPSEWHSLEGDVLRVETPVRVRVHRECHRCHKAFGVSNECVACGHKCCKQCIRYPPKRTESEKAADREKITAMAQREMELAPIIPHYGLAPPVQVTRPGPNGGQDRVYKPARMRPRRYCHECGTIFHLSSVCQKCNHKRCGDCPRDPASKDKYPYGYPGDDPGANTPTLHSCHECRRKFPLNAKDGADCSKCGHKKCAECPRLTPKRSITRHDPAELKGLQEQLRGISLGETME